METRNIKRYAPVARREFRAAVMRRMNELGIYSDAQISVGALKGDAFVVDGKAFNSSIQPQHLKLVAMVKAKGFINVVDEVASTWFNRLCAIRFMELKEYLDHGYRVLSHPKKINGFQILEHAADVAEELGLNRSEVLEMSLAGDKEEELYRQLLLGQCHALHDAMDFLFDKVDSVSELLLPDGLTRTDSILRSLVDDVPEEDWDQVEIIGWLYQFYISEKKDEVIGKVVKSEDIPAATQLFTPNWIVKYLVHNSVGHQWLQAYPESDLVQRLKRDDLTRKREAAIKHGIADFSNLKGDAYYTETAEQSNEENVQLSEVAPSCSLEPEAIKVLDPACGSGHILVEAYNTLKAIYDERGYRSREIPQLILENNLFGLDIDDRAAQLAGFALMMMAREDDRRIFTRGVKLNVLSLQESTNLDIQQLWRELDLNNDQEIGQGQDLFADQEAELDVEDAQFKLLQQIKQWFLQAKTLGSLIDVPADNSQQLRALKDKLVKLQESGNTAQKPAAELLLPFVQQAWLLSQRYDSVIANPPYMGSKGMNKELRTFVNKKFPLAKADLFSVFMERAFDLLSNNGYNAQINMQSWMFLSSFEKLRLDLLKNKTIITMAHLGPRAFSQISGEVVQTTAWVISNKNIESFRPVFYRLIDGNEKEKSLNFFNKKYLYSDSMQSDFQAIPGEPIAYWLNNNARSNFKKFPMLDSIAPPKQGATTSDNNRFLRLWFECDYSKICFTAASRDEAVRSQNKWFPFNKGGEFRKWYGNAEFVINYKNDGEEIKSFHEVLNKTSPGGRLKNQDCYFKPQISWSKIAAGSFCVRAFPKGFIFSDAGSALFPINERTYYSLSGVLNSTVSDYFLSAMSPTLNYEVEHIKKLPIVIDENSNAEELIRLSKLDWDSFETSWDFKELPILATGCVALSDAFRTKENDWKDITKRVLDLEKSNDEFFIDAYSLSEEVQVNDCLSKVTLMVNPLNRYGNGDSAIANVRFRSDTIAEFVSYSLGCMMGRYSLDREGLVYAHSGNEGFTDLVNQGAYKTFAADDDGIIPLTDMEWFPDDATYRFRDFVRTVWGEEYLQENLDFVAESLCLHAIKPKRGESSLDTIRRYMSAQFYKDHLKTYKKRPIYWLFSSGKQKAFECLVYLHRYNESTLSRMRTEYVTPLLGKYEARLGQLEQQLESASTSEKTKLKKEMTALEKKQAELRTFDDKLKHFADMRISLDLDDGVKVNYGKFGDLLADVKAIHGKVVK